MEAGAAVLNESVIYLPQVGSTNAWAKENIAQFGPVGAVYTTDQTAGRGRLGRGWVDAPGKGLYYTAVIKTDLAQPSTFMTDTRGAALAATLPNLPKHLLRIMKRSKPLCR